MRFAAAACILAIGLVFSAGAFGAGQYHVVEYPPSTTPGELVYGVTYTVWIPDGVQKLRGLIVHQHGCGAGACRGGETAAYDLHWQELAKKWDCALAGPSYHQPDKENCRLWCDPRNGSEATFLRSLSELGKKANHPELETAPWCLWGHSGGGFWASLMQARHPERVVAVWFRSGSAYTAWESGQIDKPEISDAVYRVPMMCNPGVKEDGDKRYQGAWTGTMAMFKAYRAKGGLIGFAPDPHSAHDCGDSRYLAIPFFDACLALRLPEAGSSDARLKIVDEKQAWLAPLLGDKAEPAASFQGKIDESVWLPNERIAKAWAEYVKDGVISDTTPPPAPSEVIATTRPDGSVELSWTAIADFESGLASFVIVRDGKEIAQLPRTPVVRFGRPLFQAKSYHDTPEAPLPELKYVDATPPSGNAPKYQIVAVNAAGLKSAPVAVGASAKNVNRFEGEILKFEASDRVKTPAQGIIVFTGASGIKRWSTLTDDFPNHLVLNRGFGGCHMSDVVYYADRIVIPYRPSLVIVQAGGNDLNSGKTPQQVLADFQSLVEKIRAKLPNTRIAYMSIGPSPARWLQREMQLQANRLIKDYIDSGKNLDYIELYDAFLNSDGEPRAELFVADRLHHNAEGYKVRTAITLPHLPN